MSRGTQTGVDVGDIVAGRYRVDRVIGSGAMGVVVAATHVELHQVRAIKFMLPDMMDDRESVERFLREARAAARLESKHSVKVHDVARLPTGEPYIVMEYLEGIDLKKHLSERKVLPVPEAVGLMLQACEAIAEAHAAGIIHRDLKPANMFLASRPGGVPCLKVLDFGIAKVSDPAGSASDGQLTSTHTVIGSPLYMSPEQIMSTKNVDARSDVWSLGVILYTLVTGAIPFRGDSTHAIFASVQRDEPTPPSAWVPNIPPGLERVIMHCLQKEPARRCQSAGDLAAGIAPFGPESARRSFLSAPSVSDGSETAAATQLYRPSSPKPPSAGEAFAPPSPATGSFPHTGQGYSSGSGPQSYPASGPGSGSQSYPASGLGSGSQSYPASGPGPGSGSQSYPASGPQNYPASASQSHPYAGSQSYPASASQSHPYAGSQSYPHPGMQGYPQAGAQTNSPVTQPVDATGRGSRKRGRELILVGGGFGTALVIVAAFVLFSRSGANSEEKAAAPQAATAATVALSPPPGPSEAPVVAPIPTPMPSAAEEPAAGAMAAQGGAPAPAKPKPAQPSPSTSPSAAPSAASKPPAPAPIPSSTGGAPLRKRND